MVRQHCRNCSCQLRKFIWGVSGAEPSLPISGGSTGGSSGNTVSKAAYDELSQKLSDANDRIAELQNQLAAAQGSGSGISQDQYDNLQAALTAAQANVTDLTNKLNDANASNNASKTTIDDLQQKIKEATDNASLLNNTITQLTGERDTLKAENEQLKEENASLKAEKEQLLARIAELESGGSSGGGNSSDSGNSSYIITQSEWGGANVTFNIPEELVGEQVKIEIEFNKAPGYAYASESGSEVQSNQNGNTAIIERWTAAPEQLKLYFPANGQTDIQILKVTYSKLNG